MNACDGSHRQAILSGLPRLDPLAWHLQGVARMLERAGVDACVETAAAGRLEVLVSLTLGGVPLKGGFDLAQWCALRFEGGSRLAFGEIDPAYLLPLIESEAAATLSRVGDLPASDWRALEVRRPAASGIRLRLDTCAGWPALMLAGWPAARYPQARRPLPWPASFDDIPVPVSLVVGRSRVTRRLMRRLVDGDVLLVQCPDWRVRVGQRALGGFSVSRQEWKMEAFKVEAFKEIRQRDNPLSAKEASSPVDMSTLDDLPVEATFLLASRTLSLAELRGLRTGATFALARQAVPGAGTPGTSRDAPAGTGSSGPASEPPPSSEGMPAQGYLVEIRINELLVGQGELVALGDQLAVQIVRLNGEA